MIPRRVYVEVTPKTYVMVNNLARLWSDPKMTADKTGTMGNTHGVKDNNNPARKSDKTLAMNLSEFKLLES